MDLIEDLNWRYATKKFTDRKVSKEKLQHILEATNLTASSCGLQPYRLFVIDNPTLQAKLGLGSFNGQIEYSSHLIVFAAYNQVTTEHIQDLVDLTAKEKEVTKESLDGLFMTLDSYFKSRTATQNSIWADKQAYIALGTALIAAANVRVDATPMEGFDPHRFDALLNLTDKGLHSTVILSIGYRDEKNDYYAGTKKVRVPLDKMATMIDQNSKFY
ncbi:nitroreductase family protein [Pedobacter sp. PAMC26386]|nr:nitroreductase family protein [Pedobacter sp. PAMC26386]